MLYSIETVDHFFFRSAEPFEAGGETHLIRSYFPPLPSVYAGALKPFVMKGLGADENKKKRLRISYNGVYCDNDFCFPKPLDTVERPDKDGKTFHLELLQCMQTPFSNFPLDVCLHDPSVKDSPKTGRMENAYLALPGLKAYLENESVIPGCFMLSDYYLKEPKLGIAIDPKSNTAKQSMIYQLQMIRPSGDLKLAVETKDIDIKEPFHVKLGGEGTMARVKPLDCALEIAPPSTESQYFKLYLAAPAIFKNGWLPQWIDPATKKGRFSYKGKTIDIKLKAAAIGRFVPVGGFGYDKKAKYKPREMRYAVPAGSVYYFQIMRGDFRDAVKLFHKRCLSDYRESYGFDYINCRYDRMRYCDRGFGYALVGTVGKEQEDILKCTQ